MAGLIGSRPAGGRDGVTQSSAANSGVRPTRLVPGIETLRLVAALWVALSHGAAPPLKELLSVEGGPLRLVFGALAASFNGTAAVVVFFLISGFCIHLPNVGRPVLDWRRFLVRRFVRICLPLLAALGAVHALGKPYVAAEDAVLWSVYCELVYYALYPALFIAFRKWGVGPLLLASTIPSAFLLLMKPEVSYLWGFGPLTWLFCAPSWLLGVELAEWYRRRSPPVRAPQIGLWRLGAVAGCIAATVGLYHLPIRIGFGWSMAPFSVYGFFWLKREIEHFELKGTAPALETMGAACYSLYLVHNVVLAAVRENLGPTEELVPWAAGVVLIAVSAAGFYLLIERPSHRLARWAGTRRPQRPVSAHQADA
ncbi:MAG: acyltransferase family protein [Phenylobacterium sp.]